MSSKEHRSKKPTQYDVAERTGVSQATVSHIPNNATAISIPEETRQRVLAAMAEIGYIPDRAARSLRTNKTYTIAAIIPDITNPFYPTFVRGSTRPCRTLRERSRCPEHHPDWGAAIHALD